MAKYDEYQFNYAAELDYEPFWHFKHGSWIWWINTSDLFCKLLLAITQIWLGGNLSLF